MKLQLCMKLLLLQVLSLLIFARLSDPAVLIEEAVGSNSNAHDQENNEHLHVGDERNLMTHSNYFKESACNANIATSPCIGIHSFLASSQSPTTTEVNVPCGTCVSMDITTFEVFDFPHGLNVVGKLDIPENASFELRTKYLLVQGLVQMNPPANGQTTIPRADGAKVKVVLTGSENVQFYPDAATDNGMACGGTDPCTIGIKPFAVAGGRLDINAIDDACPAWTKLDSLSADMTQITLSDPAAAACWATGASIMFTSDGVAQPFATQEAKISNSDPETGIITLDAPLGNRVTSVQDGYGEHYAVEVALITRRITFVPDGDNADLIGGHTIILHTPSVVQNIKGIEFLKFGQQGNLGRYPLHFHMSDHVTGSTVAKNLVKDSNQRCYVIHGTHGVRIEENVAYNTFGHCYMTEDGGEWENSFIRNLGAKTKPPAKLISAGESDGEPSTFWMPTPVNHYYGNVAAGSSHFGFWLEPKLRGPTADLAINAGKRPMYLPMGAFEDNVAHSNAGQGIAFYPLGYSPPDPQVSRRLIALKNGGAGLRVGGANNMHLEGGLIADNTGGGIECSGGSYNLARDLTIERISSHQRAMRAEGRSTVTPCSTGITFPSDKGKGSEFYNLVMKGFDHSDGCEASAFAPSSESPRHGLYTSLAVFSNITFDFPDPITVSVCAAVGSYSHKNSIRNIAYDLFGATGLSPTGEGGYFLQNNDPGLTTFMPSNCQPAGGCLNFCPNACYRHIVMTTSGSAIHEGKQMVVTDVSSGVSVATPRKMFQRFWGFQDVAYFGIALPFGSQYSISWIDANGNHAWPGFVKPQFQALSDCSPVLDESDVNIVAPPVNERCDNIVYNGDLERGDFFGWQDHSGSGMSMVQGGAENSYWALRTNKVGRNEWHGLWNFVDASCLQAWAGNFIRISGYIKVLDMTLQDVASSCEVEFWIDGQIMFYRQVPTLGDGSWAKVDEIIYLPGMAANAVEANLVFKGGHKLHLALDEWRIEDQSHISFEYELQSGSSGGCSSGYSINSAEECKAVGVAKGGRLRNGVVVTGTWSHVPCGCSLQAGLDIHYDTNMDSCNENDGNFLPLCRKTPSLSPSISDSPTFTSPPSMSPVPSRAPSISSSPTDYTEACYLASMCPAGFDDRGKAGIIAQSNPGFDQGASYGWGFTWFHPQLCCGDHVPTDPNTKAMCGNQDPNGETIIGHWLDVNAGDPYKTGGSFFDDDWNWRHPKTCSADSSSVCVFSEVEKCRPGYKNWGKARIIMEDTANFPFVSGQYITGWNYHTPWLCCHDDIDSTASPSVSLVPSPSPPDVEACYLSGSSPCEAGFVDEGRAGIIGGQTVPEFSKGGTFGYGWYWYHPWMCCGMGEPSSSNTYAMCPAGNSIIGHQMIGTAGDPYGNGGGDVGGGWNWRHPFTCAPHDPTACVFSKVDECPHGYTNKGDAKLIMHTSAIFPRKVGAMNSSWNYHMPVLCCKD